MELIKIAELIQSKILILSKMRSEIKERAENKAIAISEYDKYLSIEIIKLKDSGGYPATLIEKIAKGNISEYRYKMELADGLYKSVISNINAVMAELNGLQSINKYLSEQ